MHNSLGQNTVYCVYIYMHNSPGQNTVYCIYIYA